MEEANWYEMNQPSSLGSVLMGLSQILTISKIQRFLYMLIKGMSKLLLC